MRARARKATHSLLAGALPIAIGGVWPRAEPAEPIAGYVFSCASRCTARIFGAVQALVCTATSTLALYILAQHPANVPVASLGTFIAAALVIADVIYRKSIEVRRH